MNQVILPQAALIVLSVGLFIMMVGVALEVKKSDWQECLKYPSSLLMTIFFQIIGVPALALIVILTLPISDALKLGILIISLCPGGVVSNFFSVRAGGNPALSSITTLISSSLIPLTFPLGIYLFTLIQPNIVILDDTEALKILSLVTVILIVPALILGFIIQKTKPHITIKLLQPLKIFSLALIAIIVVVTLFKNRHILVDEILIVFPMTFLFNTLLLTTGFWLGKFMCFPTQICRTISLELGIQNIGIALLTIPTLFPDTPTVLNIAAFWGVWHLITGLAVSHYWGPKSRFTSNG